MFKDICLMEGNEYLHTFLLKNLYHQLGSDTLHIITNCIECRWIIPEHVMDELSQVFICQFALISYNTPSQYQYDIPLHQYLFYLVSGYHT